MAHSGEYESVRAMAAARPAGIDRNEVARLRAEVDALPLAKTSAPSGAALSKRCTIAALEEACVAAGGQRALARAARFDESTVRNWIEASEHSDRHNIPLAIVDRLPAKLAWRLLLPLVKRWPLDDAAEFVRAIARHIESSIEAAPSSRSGTAG